MVALENMYNNLRQGTTRMPSTYTLKKDEASRIQELSGIDMITVDKAIEMGTTCFKASTRHVNNKSTPRQKHRSIKACKKLTTEQINFLLADSHMKSISDWSFDVFALNQATNGRALYHVIINLFQHHNLIEEFQLDPVKLDAFATMVEEGYHSNPYHNAVHAADVTQAMHYYITQNKIAKHMLPIEKLISLVSAITHDLDHPGVNQGFLIATNHHLAALHENKAVLEKHHWKTAIEVIHQTGLFNHLPEAIRNRIETDMKSLILATDMTRQQEFFTTLKKRVSEDSLDMSEYSDRHFILQIALKCADISNPCRPWSLCKTWSDKVCQEFFSQGDLEKERKLTVSPLCDRNSNTIPKIQTGFISFVVQPLFSEFDKYLFSHSTSVQLKNLSYNLQKWHDLSARPRSLPLPVRTELPVESQANNDIPSPTPSIDDDEESESEDQIVECKCPREISKIINRRLSLPILNLFRRTHSLVRRQSFPNIYRLNSHQQSIEEVLLLEELAGRLLPKNHLDQNNNDTKTLRDALKQILSCPNNLRYSYQRPSFPKSMIKTTK